jgi:hypothetical protein
MMLVFLSLLLLGLGSQAAPQPQAQDNCIYVDEEACTTVGQEVCEDGVEWDCYNTTRNSQEGVNVIECDPTSKTICTPKTRYEPEEYLDDECTTTTEEVCKWNYDTKLVKHNVTECSTTYQRECTQVPGERGVVTRMELRCTCDVCTTVYEECNCDKYNKCEKCPTEKCHEGPTQQVRSNCDNEMCNEVEIHTAKKSPPGERCIERPTEYCSVVERERSEVVKRKDCNHISKDTCVEVKKIRQKPFIYQECLVHTEDGCKEVHKYITNMEGVENCDPVTKTICSLKPKTVCKPIKSKVCGGH